MANGTSAAGGLLEGLVGGALLGSDFRRQRTFDRQDAEDRKRRQRLEDERLRMFREDRGRSQAIEGLALRDERGLAFGTPEPTPVEELRTGAGKALMTFEDLQNPEARQDVLQARAVGRGTPEGFYRVAPDPLAAESERVRALREGVGQFLAAPEGQQRGMLSDPNVIGGLGEFDLLDDIMGRFGATEEGPFKVNVGGISTTARTPEEAIEARGRFALPEEPEPVDPTSLRKEFATDPVVEESAVIGQSYRRIQEIGSQDPSGAGDLALIFSFMKLIEPNSTVREGEFANAENAQGVGARVRNMYNRVLEGERLSEEGRADFMARAEDLARAQARSLEPVLERYRGLAERNGFDPIDVLYNPLEGLTDTSGGGEGGGGEPPPAAEWQARARELRQQGMPAAEIALTLRREGLIR